MAINYISEEALEQLKAELNELKTKGRSEVAAAISEAREKGDLKENAEYDAAKEAQGMLEARIARLENDIANSRILDTKDLDLSKVSILCQATIKNVKTGKSVTYQIVSDAEADLKQKKISVNSPIGRALLGRSVGEIADVETPNGVMQFEVEAISL